MKKLKEIFNEYAIKVLFAILLILAYLVVENYFSYKFKPDALTLFRPEILFKIAFVGLPVIFLLIQRLVVRSRKVHFLEIFLLFLYLRYRLWDTPWHFWAIWKDSVFQFLDIVPVYFGLRIIFISLPFKAKLKVKNGEYGYFIPDLPLQNLSDLENKPIDFVDTLKRRKFATQIVKDIEKIVPYKSFAIGINGSWGSGKSSLFDLIKDEIKKTNGKKYKIIDFSPWFYNSSESLIKNFFLALEEKNRDQFILNNELRSYGNELAVAEASLFKTDFSRRLLSEDVSLERRYKSITAILERSQEVQLVFIDDLDRLHGDEILDVLKLIRITADFPNTIYFVGYDRVYIESAIESALNETKAKTYLDKIFNVEFAIPESNVLQIKDHLKNGLTAQLKTLKLFDAIDKRKFHDCFSNAQLVHFIRTERDVKRFINGFLMRYIPLQKDIEIDFEIFFLLQLINYANPNYFKSIYDNKENILRGNNEPNLEATRGGNGVTPEMEGVVSKIFNINSENAVRHKLHFDKYFTLSLFKGISEEEFNACFMKETPEFVHSLMEYWHDNYPNEVKTRFESKLSGIEGLELGELSPIALSLIHLYNYSISKLNRFLQLDPSSINPNNLSKYIRMVLDRNFDLKAKLIGRQIEAERSCFVFSNQPSDDKLGELNHDFYPEFFDLNSINTFQIEVEPIATKYWRLGFIFLKSEKKSALTPYNQHDNPNRISAHICIGKPDTAGGGYEWKHDHIVEFPKYSPDFVAESTFKGISDYKGEPLILSLTNLRQQKMVKIDILYKGESVGHRLYKVEDFRYFAISAWADRISFSLKTKFTITPSSNSQALN